MAPFIRDGDVVTISPLGSDRRQLGGVIAVSLPGSRRLVIHRAVARVGSSWLVRGDNSPRPDGLVRAADALGRVVRVERAGRTVVVGCGPERILIALLSRYDLLIPLMACARRMVRQRARQWRRSA